MNLLAFETKYPPHPPRKAPANEDEKRMLGPEDGVLALLRPPVPETVRVAPGPSKNPAEGRHLWVFFQHSVPLVLEIAPRVRRPLQSGVAKHSNLTGAGQASCGGEM